MERKGKKKAENMRTANWGWEGRGAVNSLFIEELNGIKISRGNSYFET